MNWKTIENYPKYEVSDCGLVMNSRGNILKPRKHRNVYLLVDLYKNGKRKTFKIHRLVAMTFIPNPENKREVDHIDRDPSNNHVDNLRWATSSENQQNTGVFCTNKLGIKYISYDKSKDRYVYQKIIEGKKVYKTFKTLDEAIEFKKSQHLTDFEYASAPTPPSQHSGDQQKSE
jgi:hypothetical protein